MKRGIATITVYVFGETEEDLKDMSKMICKNINHKSDFLQAKTESIYCQEFGEIGDLKKIL